MPFITHNNNSSSSGNSNGSNKLLNLLGIFQGYKRKKKNDCIKRITPSNKETKLITSKPYEPVRQPVLTPRLSVRNLAKAIQDSGISMSRSASSGSTTSILPEETLNELDLMVSQHYILRTAFDADFSASIPCLENKENSNTVVLDVGCGSGTWTMEMATQFPHASFIGIDKKSIFPHDIKPKNCHFKVFDIHQSKLPFQDQTVDYIFQRDLNWDMPESAWLPLVQEFFRILKPGGWIELVEPEIETHSSVYSNNPSHEDYLINKLIGGFHIRQQDPFISKRLSSLMAIAGFRRITSDFQSLPLGWGYQKHCPSTKTHLRCSEFARAAASHRLDLFRALQPWFTQGNHISKAKYEAYIGKLPEDWNRSKAYTNWHRSTAQKPLA